MPRSMPGCIEAVAAAITSSPEIEAVLMSPRVPKARKVELVGQALRAAPAEFVRFIQAVVRRGRQLYFADIAREYGALVDTKFNRLRAAVSLAREPNEALQESIRAELSRAFGKEVHPTFYVDRVAAGRHHREGRETGFSTARSAVAWRACAGNC